MRPYAWLRNGLLVIALVVAAGDVWVASGVDVLKIDPRS
jgi:hypothetical protein